MSRNKIFRCAYISMHFRIKFLLFKDFPSYVVCPKSKCSDFPMGELVKQHLVDVYQRIGSDLGCMSIHFQLDWLGQSCATAVCVLQLHDQGETCVGN